MIPPLPGWTSGSVREAGALRCPAAASFQPLALPPVSECPPCPPAFPPLLLFSVPIFISACEMYSWRPLRTEAPAFPELPERRWQPHLSLPADHSSLQVKSLDLVSSFYVHFCSFLTLSWKQKSLHSSIHFVIAKRSSDRVFPLEAQPPFNFLPYFGDLSAPARSAELTQYSIRIVSFPISLSSPSYSLCKY